MSTAEQERNHLAEREGGDVSLMQAPRGMRMHIAFFGRRNVGKSSLLNALTRQRVSIVSEEAGTTTDPVEKPMEFLPLGPVLFIDTAGIDDVGALGELRTRRTNEIFDRTDLGLIVTEPGRWGEFEELILDELCRRGTPALAVFNKVDRRDGNGNGGGHGHGGEVVPPQARRQLAAGKVPIVEVSASTKQGLPELRQALLESAPEHFLESPPILGDLVGPGELALLVVPIDKEAPKGRLILPEAQSIRDLLDAQALALVAREQELAGALARLNQPPRLVVTDSQAFAEVAALTPSEVPLTSFSILFARFKGDLLEQVKGVLALDRLVPGDRVLIAEACSHHPIADDIGRVKLPRWLQQHVGGELAIEVVQGHDFPPDLASYKVVIHCGACMLNRRAMLSRLLRCRAAGVPITNYGLVIAHVLGILERALAPFPAAWAEYRAACGEGATDTKTGFACKEQA